MSRTILLTHTPHMRRNYYGDDALAGLRALGNVRLHEGDAPLDVAGLIAAGQDAEIIVCDRSTAGPAEIFAALPRLCALVRPAVDIRNVDVAAASQRGVLATHASPGFIPAVAELILGMMIDLSRGISNAVRVYQAGQAPAAVMGRQLAGSTLGIIGYGSIARYLAPLGTALGMQVLIADPYAAAPLAPLQHVTLDALLPAADYVVCLAVANDATENLMGAAAFARMRPSAFFINASRGNLVDEAALAHALQTQQIAGAALDVGRALDQMPSLDLAVLPGVIATPHIGGLTPEAIAHQALESVEQVRTILAGAVPVGAINAAEWRRRPA